MVEPKFAQVANMVTWKLGLSARKKLLLELDHDKIFSIIVHSSHSGTIAFVAVNQLNITSSLRQTVQPPPCQSQKWGLLGVHPSHLQTTLSFLAIPLSRLFLGLLRFLEARLGFSSPFDLGHSSDRSVKELGSLCWPLYLHLTAFPLSSTSHRLG